MFSNYVYQWLDNALDMGISESEFWNMTVAELKRAMDSKQRVQKAQAQERASFDYILADLVARSLGRMYSSSNKMPDISEAYPSLFNSQEIQQKRQEQQAEISALRFKQFAESFNKKFSGGAKEE